MKLRRAVTVCSMLAAIAAASEAQPSPARWDECAGALQVTGILPASLPQCIANSGRRATKAAYFSLGASTIEMQRKSSFPLKFDPILTSDDPVNIVWIDGSREFRFEDVGGTDQSVLTANIDPDIDALSNFSFSWQNRPMRLDETIEKARRLERWLREAGYRPVGNTIPAERLGPEEPSASAVEPPIDWPQQRSRLLDDHNGVSETDLLTVRSWDTQVSISIENARRKALSFQSTADGPRPPGRRTIFDGNGGYEWFLKIYIGRPEGSP